MRTMGDGRRVRVGAGPGGRPTRRPTAITNPPPTANKDLCNYKNFGGAAAVIPDSKLSAVRALSFVTSVNQDTVRQLDAVAPPAGTTALPGRPYWQDLIDAENNTIYNGSGVWVAVLDSGFYPNWRDYFVESDILTDKARAFVAANGNPNVNQWDVGSDPHGMATAATITGYRFVDAGSVL